MRRQKLFVVLFVAGVVGFGLSVAANEKPSDEYKKAMRDLAAFNMGIEKAIMAEDYDTVQKLAASAKAAFGVTENYWASRNADATKLAQTGGKAAADLDVAAGLKSADGANYAMKGVREVCAPCHMARRERLADGTFEIKN